MNWTSYLIQANLYLVLFYAFYWVVLRRETFFNLNRYYLLFASIAAALIPLIKTSWFTETAQPVQQRFAKATLVVMDGYASPIRESWTLGDILMLIYLGGILLLIVRLIYKLTKLNRMLNDKDQKDAFSFFWKVRINRNLPEQTTIEKHELTHAQQLHSADILLFEMIAIINWFNPIIYCYKSSIKHIHEFIADEVVINSEIDKQDYALLLLSKNFGVATHTLTNNFFNQSLLKRRIEMMNKTKSRKTAIIKYGLSAPLFLLAVVLSSAKISESKTIGKLAEKVKPNKELSEILMPDVGSSLAAAKTKDNSLKIAAKRETKLVAPDSVGEPKSKKSTEIVIRNPIGDGTNLNDATDDNPIFTNVEVLPSFPGGLEAFGKFLAKNMKYPDEAKAYKTQGRVFCQFVVEKDGSLTNIRVIRGIGSGCDEEAIRVLTMSPKWNPGVQDGSNVRVSYTIPILFQLKDEKGGSQINDPFGSSAKNAPLVIVDGIETEDKEKFKTMNPNDIESINVLKDKASTAKYGDKGKNGVIEITTKKK